MNTIENKKQLWNLLLDSKGFKHDMGVDKTREVFETVVQEVDRLQYPLEEKNRLFLAEFMKRIHQTHDTQQVDVFEERMKEQDRHKKPVKDLTEIKQLLYQILERLDQL
jgi:hypothetical protein